MLLVVLLLVILVERLLKNSTSFWPTTVFQRQLPLVLWLPLNGETGWIEPFILVRQHQWDEVGCIIILQELQTTACPMSTCPFVCLSKVQGPLVCLSTCPNFYESPFPMLPEWLDVTSTSIVKKGKEIRSIWRKVFKRFHFQCLQRCRDWSRVEGH